MDLREPAGRLEVRDCPAYGGRLAAHTRVPRIFAVTKRETDPLFL